MRRLAAWNVSGRNFRVSFVLTEFSLLNTLETRNGYITARSAIGAFMLIQVPESFLSFFLFCRRNPGKLIFDLILKLIQGNDVHEIKLDIFKHPFIGTLAYPTLQQ